MAEELEIGTRGSLGIADFTQQVAKMRTIRQHIFLGAFMFTLDSDGDRTQPLVGGELQFVSILQDDVRRSEEHTSELQSLMRISYAVFCLKKKNNIQTKEQYNTTNATNSQTNKII